MTSMSTSSLRPLVLIAGAGLGGLALAGCLLRRGIRVRVFEQADRLGEIGAGVQASANAVKVLHHLGLREPLARLGVRPHAFEYRRFDSGALMHRIALGAQHEQLHGAPYYHLHRADLHNMLIDSVNEIDSDCIELSARATGYRETENGVTLLLADGREVAGDVLVGADGIRSAVRAQLAGATPANYTGDVAWRGVVPVDRLPDGVMDTVSTVWCGPQKHAVMYYIRGGSLMNFVGLVARSLPDDVESWTQRRPWEELKRDFEGWHPSIQVVIDALDRDACFRYALNDRPPLPTWSTARVTLLGDAAHPTLPYLASGAAMAIEDAAVLARCLEGGEQTARALIRYQHARMERTSRVVRGSADSRTLYRIESEDDMRRAFGQQAPATSRAQWLYSYDPLEVPLDDPADVPDSDFFLTPDQDNR